jgi:hypothetical protein
MQRYPFLSLILLPPLLLHGCNPNTTETSAPEQAATSPEQTVVATAVTVEASDQEDERTIQPPPAPADQEITELDWDTLIPLDWRPDRLLMEFDAENLSDDDPRAQELMDKLKALWKESPVVYDYDGKQVKLPGFVVPLDMDARTINEFLLVPYYGACIHTPPPPSNQIVHVVADGDAAFQGELFDPVWVTGTMRVESVSSDLGDAGYRIEAMSIIPYE